MSKVLHVVYKTLPIWNTANSPKLLGPLTFRTWTTQQCPKSFMWSTKPCTSEKLLIPQALVLPLLLSCLGASFIHSTDVESLQWLTHFLAMRRIGEKDTNHVLRKTNEHGKYNPGSVELIAMKTNRRGERRRGQWGASLVTFLSLWQNVVTMGGLQQEDLSSIYGSEGETIRAMEAL